MGLATSITNKTIAPASFITKTIRLKSKNRNKGKLEKICSKNGHISLSKIGSGIELRDLVDRVTKHFNSTY